MSLVALSELLGATVRDANGTVRGRVREIAVAPQDHPTRIAYLIVRTADGERALPASAIKSLRRRPSATDGDDAAAGSATRRRTACCCSSATCSTSRSSTSTAARWCASTTSSSTRRRSTATSLLNVVAVDVGARGAIRRLAEGRRARRSRCGRCSSRFRRASSRGSTSTCSRPTRRAASS